MNGTPETDIISFTTAGPLHIGGDAELRHGCLAMLEEYQSFMERGRVQDYSDVCCRIEERAEEVAPLRATTPEGVRLKAEIVHKLNVIGMAGYAGRILAASLAMDLLEPAL